MLHPPCDGDSDAYRREDGSAHDIRKVLFEELEEDSFAHSALLFVHVRSVQLEQVGHFPLVSSRVGC